MCQTVGVFLCYPVGGSRSCGGIHRGNLASEVQMSIITCSGSTRSHQEVRVNNGTSIKPNAEIMN